MNPAIPHTTKQLPEDAQSRTAKFQTMMFEVTVDPANGAIHATHDEHPSLHACATTLEGLAIELAQALAGHVQHATTHSDADFNPRGRRD